MALYLGSDISAKVLLLLHLHTTYYPESEGQRNGIWWGQHKPPKYSIKRGYVASYGISHSFRIPLLTLLSPSILIISIWTVMIFHISRGYYSLFHFWGRLTLVSFPGFTKKRSTSACLWGPDHIANDMVLQFTLRHLRKRRIKSI